MPGQVGREHPDQHVGPDAFFQPVEDRPQVRSSDLMCRKSRPAFPAYLALACSSSGKAPVRSAQCFLSSERKVVTAYQPDAGSRVTGVAPCRLIGA